MKKHLLLLLLLTAGYGSAAQTYTLTFDKDGRMDKTSNPKGLFPSLSHDTTIAIEKDSIKVPASAFLKSVSSLPQRITAITSPTATTGSVRQLNLIGQHVQQAVNAKITLFDSITAGQIAGPASDTCVTALVSNSTVLVYDPCDSIIPIKVASKNSDEWPVQVTGNYYGILKQAKRAIKVGTVSNNTLDIQVKSDSLERVEYQITRRSADNEILQQHFKKTRSKYKGWPVSYQRQLDTLKTAYRKRVEWINAQLLADSVNAWACGDTVQLPFRIRIVNAFDSLKNYTQQIDRFYEKVLCDNAEWIQSWLWYTGGIPMLNPFAQTDPAPALAQVNRQLLVQEEQIKVLNKFIQCCTQEKGAYEKAQQQMELLVRALDDSRSRIESLRAQKKKFDDWRALLTLGSSVLYRGVWFAPSEKELLWEHHYDAADQFNFLTAKDSLPNMVAEQDQVVVYTHNVKTTDTLTLKAAEAALQVRSQLEAGLDPVAQQFGQLNTEIIKLANRFGNIIAGPPRLIQVAGAFIEKGKTKTWRNEKPTPAELRIRLTLMDVNPLSINTNNRKLLDELIGLLRESVDPVNQALENELRQLRELGTGNSDRIAFVKRVFYNLNIQDRYDYELLIGYFLDTQNTLTWLTSQTNPMSPYELKENDNALYRTDVKFPEQNLKMTTSKTVSYSLTQSGRAKPEVEASYAKYKLVRWWPTVGIAYIPSARSGSVFSTTLGQFETGNTFDNFEALVGVKYYLIKGMNIGRDNKTRRLINRYFPRIDSINIKRGNNLINNLFLTGGLGVRHQFLRNYYLGAGFDFVPGFSFQMGVNFIFPKYYVLENGQVKNQYERPRWPPPFYIGLGLDPNIVKQLITIFR